MRLEKSPEPAAPNESSAVLSAASLKIARGAFGDGLPAVVGGTAAMAVAGVSFLPALGVGLISGGAYAFLRHRHHA